MPFIGINAVDELKPVSIYMGAVNLLCISCAYLLVWGKLPY